MAILEISVMPLGTETPSVSKYVAGAQRVVTTMKIDERRDQKATIQSKVVSVKRELEK